MVSDSTQSASWATPPNGRDFIYKFADRPTNHRARLFLTLVLHSLLHSLVPAVLRVGRVRQQDSTDAFAFTLGAEMAQFSVLPTVPRLLPNPAHEGQRCYQIPCDKPVSVLLSSSWYSRLSNQSARDALLTCNGLRHFGAPFGAAALYGVQVFRALARLGWRLPPRALTKSSPSCRPPACKPCPSTSSCRSRARTSSHWAWATPRRHASRPFLRLVLRADRARCW